MNKSDLIDAIAEKMDTTKAKSSEFLNTLLDVVKDTLKNGDSIVLPGFGTFTVSQRSARAGRNPQTGETIMIPAVRVPKFKAGKQLKEAVK